jgi:hypothetical protein
MLVFTKREVWLISAPGCSLSAGRAVSLLVAKAPAGSHLSRCSRRSLAPSAPINFFINGFLSKNLILKKQSYRKEPLFKKGKPHLDALRETFAMLKAKTSAGSVSSDPLILKEST